jgi:hypothetical protein
MSQYPPMLALGNNELPAGSWSKITWKRFSLQLLLFESDLEKLRLTGIQFI